MEAGFLPYEVIRRQERKARKYLGIEKVPCFFVSAATDDYEEAKEVFKKLFNSGRKDLRDAAWNNISVWDTEDMERVSPEQIRREDFSDAEYEFILERLEASRKRPIYNPSKPIVTPRLILRADDSEEAVDLFAKHLEEDGDLGSFTSLTPNDENFFLLSTFGRYTFAIFERSGGRMIGVVDVHSVDEGRHMCSIMWYIFKPYRRMGYGREAVSALAGAVFDGRLCRWISTQRADVYRRHYLKIDLIRADIMADNIPSRRLAESCGFELMYIDERHFLMEDTNKTKDGAIYHLAPEG